MIPWSSLRPAIQRITFSNLSIAKRCMSEHRTLPIGPSRWQWNKLKNLLHFYVMVGAIPLTALVFYTNVFIGPATLTEIPEDYVPKYWEYFNHPITRFLARYIYKSHQQEYEKYLHLLYEEDEKMKMRLLEKKVKQKMAERKDYQAYYYIPFSAKQHRIVREESEEMATILGVDPNK